MKSLGLKDTRIKTLTERSAVGPDKQKFENTKYADSTGGGDENVARYHVNGMNYRERMVVGRVARTFVSKYDHTTPKVFNE